MPNTKSISFDGVDECVYITDVNQTGLDGMTDLSIEFWINFHVKPSVAGRQYPLTKWAGGAETASYCVDFNPGAEGNDKMRIQITDGVNYTRGTTDSDVILSIDTWYHIAFTYDGSAKELKIYVNGSPVAFTYSNHAATDIEDSSADFSIGGQREGGSLIYQINGKMDEVRVWDLVRSEAQISANYQVELTGSEDGLVGYWKFNDSLLDETADNNDLTATGSLSYSTDVPFSGAPPAAAHRFFQMF